MKCPFKKGDRVREKSNKAKKDVVLEVPGMKEYDSKPFVLAERGMVLEHAGWDYWDRWELDREEEDMTELLVNFF